MDKEFAKKIFDLFNEVQPLSMKFERKFIMPIERRNNPCYIGPITHGWWDYVEGHPVDTGNSNIDKWLNNHIDSGKVTELYEITYFDGYGHYKLYKFKELDEIKIWQYAVT